MEILENMLYLQDIEAIFVGFAYYCIHNFIYDWPKANWVDRRFFSSFDFYVFFKADKDCTIRVFRIPLCFFCFIFALLRLTMDFGLKYLLGQLRCTITNQQLFVCFSFFEMYNVNYKGEVTSLFVGCSKKSNSCLSVLLRSSETVTSS